MEQPKDMDLEELFDGVFGKERTATEKFVAACVAAAVNYQQAMKAHRLKFKDVL